MDDKLTVGSINFSQINPKIDFSKFVQVNKEKIEQIARQNPNTVSKIEVYEESLQLIHDICMGYDEFSTEDGLNSLIDEIRNIAIDALCIEKEG